jgi:lipopolysaccharide transport system ATP-binding protein
MSKLAIKVEGLYKQYRLGLVGTGTLAQDLNRWWHVARGKEDPYELVTESNDRTSDGGSDYVWALQDINFEVQKGEVLGVIGKNGAGKSTLLKVLSKVTGPSKGSVKVNGRVASLLEVGTGFHPELTGRENIYLNGAILGMTRGEIKRKFDEIVDFSGVQKYIDTPVKRYSSGMYVRLAFAVAAHLEPEILIVDEVLAVGDAEFQKKCIGKMKDVSTNEGRTILFVSHNMDAISRLCTRSIYMKQGQVIGSGTTDAIIQQYIGAETSITSRINYEDLASAPGNEMVKLLNAEMVDGFYTNKLNFKIDELVGVRFTFQVLKATDDLVCGFNLYNQLDVHILSSHDTLNNGKKYKPGIYSSTVWMPQNFLTEGLHYCGVAAMSYKPFTVHFHDVGRIGFNIADKQSGETVRGDYTGVFPGVVRPKLNWDIIKGEND